MGSLTCSSDGPRADRVRRLVSVVRAIALCSVACLVAAVLPAPAEAAYPADPFGRMFGVNLAVAEFGRVPGAFGKDYAYPNASEFDYFKEKGLLVVRLPFRWARLQRELNGELDQAELGRIDRVVGFARERGMGIILDVHDYARYGGKIIGSPEVPNSAFTDFWRRVADHFKNERAVWAYGLMNEPHDTGGLWPAAAQAGVDGIRAVDMRHVILVSGEAWSGAWHWPKANRDLRISDPANNHVFEAHQYFDKDGSGTYKGGYDSDGAYPNIGVDRVKPFIDWLEAHNARGFLGEYGVPDDDPRWLTVLDNFLAALRANGVGGTYWAAGPWWGRYPLSVEPRSGQDRPQMSILAKYAHAAPPAVARRGALSPGEAGLPVTGKTAEVLRKLGRRHFMLGLTSGPGDRWIEETRRRQGCRWDMRYQYIAGGVNRPRNWKNWNSPPGAFATGYMRDTDRMGVVPVFSWYQMYQSLPDGGSEPASNKTNSENVDTMRQYLSDMKLFMEKAGEFGKPVILHVEPDLWGFYLIAGEFRPNDPDTIRVIVKSTGLADVAEFDDTMAGFGKAIVALRDRYAPNVLLGWHASKWGHPSTAKFAQAIKKCGDWDIIFVDPSDRDAGWKVAHGYYAQGAWWKDSDFGSFRDWSGQLHKLTGLPLIAWQIPVGNTIMASCNNTESHFMDNRVQHWLEGYPKNTNVLEWAKRGFIALLFGGGAGGCTGFRDDTGDGITNPPPVEGNRGEQARFPDDDGGYLRLRGAEYYRKPLALLLPEDLRRVAKRRRTPPRPEQPDRPRRRRPKKDALAAWDAKLLARVRESVAGGRAVRFSVNAFQQQFEIVSVDEAGRMRLKGPATELDMDWSGLEIVDRRNLAVAVLSEGEPEGEGHCLVAFYLIAAGDEASAREHLEMGGAGASEVEAAFEALPGAAAAAGRTIGEGEPPRRRERRRSPPPGASPGREGSPRPAVDPAAQPYREAETAFIDGEVDRARRLFEEVVREYPDSEYAAKAKSYLEIIE